jgi:hypothetical protein
LVYIASLLVEAARKNKLEKENSSVGADTQEIRALFYLSLSTRKLHRMVKIVEITCNTYLQEYERAYANCGFCQKAK